jgi:glycosyltransferase involved in cell wall biosynthesis
MKILHIITSFGRGGAEIQLLMLTKYQRNKLGCDVSVCFLKGQGEMVEEFKDAGIRVMSLDGLSLCGIPALISLQNIIKKEDIDIVHTHLMKANFIGGIAAKLGGVKRIIAHKHNDEEFMKKRHYAFIHDVSSRHVRNYFHNYGLLAPRYEKIIYYGFDPSVFKRERIELRNRFGIKNNAYIFGTVARIAPQKGIEVLIDAFELVKACGDDIHLIIVGGPGFDTSYVETVYEQAKKSKYSHHIHFTGVLENPMDVYRSFDCFILASRWEGFGMVLLEAMFAGCPIIATNASAIPEVVRPNKDGILVPPGDAVALATAMEARIKNRSYGSTFNRERLDFFSPQKSFEQIDAVYNEVRK